MKKFKHFMLTIGAGMVGVIYFVAAFYITALVLDLICHMG